MSQVTDPVSADSEVKFVSRVSASPVVTPSQRGFLLRRGAEKWSSGTWVCQQACLPRIQRLSF